MNGVIYIRVSSDQQVKGTSLDHQDERCRKYCQDKSIDVAEIFREEGESAKTADRTELLRALAYCKKHKRTIDAFVVYKLDRFARFTEDHFALRKILGESDIKLHSAMEPIGDKPEERFIETVLAGAAEYDNAVRRQRSIDGMSAKVNQGLWPWNAPLGYLNTQCKKRGEKKTRPNEPDLETFSIVQQGLQEYGLGLHTHVGLARRLDELGLSRATGRKTYHQVVDKLLARKRLKFYLGIIENPWTQKDVPGLHAPMITRQEYGAIQRVLRGRKPAPKKIHRNPLFPLRRTVRCGSCNTYLTASSPRGQGGTYPYYHCFKRECPRYAKHIAKAELEEAFEQHLDAIIPKPSTVPMFKETIRRLWEHAHGSSNENQERRVRQLAALTTRKDRIYEMREDGAYSKEEFDTRRASVEQRIEELQTQIDTQNLAYSLDNFLEFALHFTSNLRTRIRGYSSCLRYQFQKLIFPDGIARLESGAFGTGKLGCLFGLFEVFEHLDSTVVTHRSTSSNGGQKCRAVDKSEAFEIDWVEFERELKAWKFIAQEAEKEMSEAAGR